MKGYWIVSYFRMSIAGQPPGPYEETKRKWYRWKWRAKLALHPRLFTVRIGKGSFAFIKTEMIAAVDTPALVEEGDA